METTALDTLPVQADAEFVASQAQHVALDDTALAGWCDALDPALLEEPDAERVLLFFDGSYRTLHYLFLLHALDFCLWPSNSRVYFRGRWLSGRAGLAAALRVVYEEGVPLWKAKVMARDRKSVV